MYRVTPLLLLFFCQLSLFAQTTIEVPMDYVTIQKALDAAENNTEILVSPGIYYENLEWPDDKQGVQLIGINGAEETIIDGSRAGRVIYMAISWSADPLDSTTVVDGFTLQNGLLTDEDGAGILASNGGPTFKNLIIQNNENIGDRASGCGMTLYGFNGSIENCIFRNNNINVESRAYGGALNIEVLGEAEILNCTFEDNSSNSNSWAYGGAIHISDDWIDGADQLTIQSCTFIENTTSTERWSYGGAIFARTDGNMLLSIDDCFFKGNKTLLGNWNDGGALEMDVTRFVISNSTFENNESESGSAIHMDEYLFEIGEGKVEACTFYENENRGSSEYSATVEVSGSIDFINCVFRDNNSCPLRLNGDTVDEYEYTILHCEFLNNFSSVKLTSIAEIEVLNSIFWENGQEEIAMLNGSELDLTNLSISHCIIQGGSVGVNIVVEEPLYINDLIPSENSPALGVGKQTDLDIDIAGNSRPNPPNSLPDIGAYEIYQPDSYITVKFYYDENESGSMDGDEQFISFGNFSANDQIYSNFYDNGVILRAEEGLYTIDYHEDLLTDWYLTSIPNFEIEIVGEENYSEVQFGLFPNSLFTKLETSIVGDPFRCGEEIDFQVSVLNDGTLVEEGVLWLMLDTRIEEYSFAVEPDEAIGDNVFGWNYSDLFIGETFTVEYKVVSPLIETQEEVGQIFTFKSWYNQTSSRFFFCYDIEHRCSFDPNDKQVFPKRSDNLALLDNPLQFLIRFQNNGNDYAKNVVVTDSLSEDLDLSTFRLISSSHPDQLQVTHDDPQVLHFQFDNIYLPDSLSQPEASQGYIQFLIYPKDGLPEETIIENDGYIYFDFNPAIVTDPTQSILVTEFPTNSIKFDYLEDLSFYPNPADNRIYFSRLLDKVTLYNTAGVELMFDQNLSNLDITQLPSGIYFMEMQIEKDKTRRKLIVH